MTTQKTQLEEHLTADSIPGARPIVRDLTEK